MGSVEQTARGLDVALSEGTHEGTHALDFGDDVAHALLHGLIRQGVKRFLEGLELVIGLGDAVGGNAQVGHTENLGGFLAGGATLSVLAIVELVRSLGIDHKQLEVVLVEVELLLGDVLQRGQLRAAVKQQRVAGGATHGSVLVKTAGGGTGHLVLGLDGGVDEGHTAGVGIAVAKAVHVVQSQSGGAGHGGGGAQAGAQRHAGDEGGVKALDLVETSLTQRPGHTGRVGGPAVHATGLEAIEISFGDLVGSHAGDDANLGVFARLQGDEGAVRQSDRQAQAGVVIGVLTDQVHTARSSPHALGRSAVGVDEQLGSLRDAFLMGQRLNEFNSSH